MGVLGRWALAAVGGFLCLGGAHALQFTGPQSPDSAGIQRIDADTNGTLYTVAGTRVFRSADSGATWAPAGNNMIPGLFSVVADGGILFALSGDGVLKSSDSGATWADFNGTDDGALPGLKNTPVPEAFDSANGFVYATTFMDGSPRLYRSPTDSAAWTDITPEDGGPNVFRVVGPNLCALVNNVGGRVSTDNGATWASNGVGSGFDLIATSPDGSQTYIGRGSGGLRVSSDNCVRTFNRSQNGFNETGERVESLAVDSDRNIYAGRDSGKIVVSTDNGVNFASDNNGQLPANTGVGVDAMLGVGANIVAGTRGGGIYANSSGMWTKAGGPAASGIYGLVDRGDTGDIGLGVLGGGYFTTDDGGATFAQPGLPDLRRVRSVLRDGTTVLLATDGINTFSTQITGFFRSTDDGATFAGVTGLPAGASTDSIVSDGSSFYVAVPIASANRGVYKSTDGGATWADVSGPFANDAVRNLAVSGGSVFAYVSGEGVYRSDDAGATWALKNSGLSGSFFGKIFATPSALIASAGGDTVYRSTDNGETWAATTGHAVSKFGIELLSMAEDGDGVVYLGDEHAGLSVSTDGGATWTPDSDGLPRSSVCIGRVQSLLVKDDMVYVGNGDGDGLFQTAILGAGTPGDSVDCTTDIDVFPDNFTFQRQDNVEGGVVATSNTIVVSGLANGVDAPISVEGGEYSIGCDGNFTTMEGTVSNGDTVCVRHTTAATGETETRTSLTIGDKCADFISKTGLIFNGGDDEINTNFGNNGLVVADIAGGPDRAEAVIVQPDGSIVMAGPNTFSAGVIGIVRMTSDGMLDTSFDTDGKNSLTMPNQNNSVRRILVQPDGKYVLVGRTSAAANPPNAMVYLARFNTDGSVDASFGTGGLVQFDINPAQPGRTELVGGAEFDSTGAIIVGGGVLTDSNGTQFWAVRFLADGTVDTNFGSDAAFFADGVANIGTGETQTIEGGGLRIDSMGRIVMGGRYRSGASLVRFNSDGTPDTAFDSDGLLLVAGMSDINAVALVGDDILFAGVNSSARPAVGKVTSAGALDSTFGIGGLTGFDQPAGAFTSVIVLADGRVAAGGNENFGSNDLLYTILSSTGSIDNNFGDSGLFRRNELSGTSLSSFAIAQRADGGVVSVGQFNAAFGALVFGGGDGVDPGDTTPDAFMFADVNNVEPMTVQTSNTITVAGIDTDAQITVTGGEYAIGCAEPGFTSAAGTIANGETVCVRHSSSAMFGGMVTTTLSIGGVTGDFSSTVRDGDRTPDGFMFNDQVDVDQSTPITSNTVTITGIDDGTAISIDVGEYSIGCDINSFTGMAGTIDNNDTVCVRHTSAAMANTAVNSELTVGTGSDVFTTTTAPEAEPDITPDAFMFTDTNDVTINTLVQSNVITVAGIDTPTSITVTGGEYSIGCMAGMFTSSAGMVSQGDTVCVSHTSAATASTATDTTLTIGGVMDTFTSTTRADAATDTDTQNNPDGQPVEIATSGGQIENYMIAAQPPMGITPPANVDFDDGYFSFDISGLNNGDSVQVTLTLPAGSTPNTFYKFQNGVAFEYLFDAADNEGAQINGNVIALNLIDGGIGDADGMADGRITDPGAPGTAAVTSPPTGGGNPNPGPTLGGGGGGGGCVLGSSNQRQDPLLWLLAAIAVGGLMRRRRREVLL